MPFQPLTFFEHSDYKPLINLKGRRLPVGPFLRVRHELKRGMLQLSWLQYTPTCLLYDYAFFDGGLEQVWTDSEEKGIKKEKKFRKLQEWMPHVKANGI